MNRKIVTLVIFGLFLSYSFTSAQNSHFAVGYAAEQEGKYLIAIKEYNKAVSNFPGAEKDLKRVLNILLKKYQHNRDKNIEVFILKTYNETKNSIFNDWLNAIYKKIVLSISKKGGSKELTRNDVEFLCKFCNQISWKEKAKSWDIVRAQIYEKEAKTSYNLKEKVYKLRNSYGIYSKYNTDTKKISSKLSELYLSAFLFGSYIEIDNEGYYMEIYEGGNENLLDSAKFFAKKINNFLIFKSMADKAMRDKVHEYSLGVWVKIKVGNPRTHLLEWETEFVKAENILWLRTSASEHEFMEDKVRKVNPIKNALAVYELIGDKENATRCKLILGIK